ncbi:MAG: isopeptide-forming domain-containing fimbrial protein, partial [Oscillospiraceae bacterium]|nr:isopeptide-forming domain-containing fimbrial protein [Oscillospiraceae bacterium]
TDPNADLTKDVKGDVVSAEGDNTTAGDTINFAIVSTAPSYYTSSTANQNFVYKNPKYTISDNLDSHFENITNIVVTVDGETTLEKGADKDYTITAGGEGNKNFTISFTENFLKEHGGGVVRVTYSSKLKDETVNNNFAENKNVATVEYSNNPDSATDVETIKSVSYHYTFAIDGDIDGENSSTTLTNQGGTIIHKTYELNKSDRSTAKKLVAEWEEVTHGTPTTNTIRNKDKLQGATFKLYKEEACRTELATTTSDVNGHINFSGLDEGTYYMKETAAPSGYTVNDTLYKFTIAATIEESSGILQGYTVTIQVKGTDGTWSAAGSATYTNTSRTVIDNVTSSDYGKVTEVITTETNPTEIINTKVANLPSTGGIGTYIFTVVGVAVIGIAVTMLVMSKKRSSNA